MPTALPIDALIVDPAIQSRAQLIDRRTVEEYAEAMKAGDAFPPVEVWRDGDTCYLSRGFQRHAAARLAGFDQIAAVVHTGTREDAIFHAAEDETNARHGLRRTNADKRHAVRNILTTERGKRLADREIARRAFVSAPLVADVRAELARTDNSYSQTVRMDRTGRQIDTTNIGKATKPADEPNATLAALYDQHEAYAGWVGEMNISIDGIGRLIAAEQVAVCTRRGPSGGLMRWYQITPAGCAALDRPALGFVPEPPAHLYPGIDVVRGRVAVPPRVVTQSLAIGLERDQAVFVDGRAHLYYQSDDGRYVKRSDTLRRITEAKFVEAFSTDEHPPLMLARLDMAGTSILVETKHVAYARTYWMQDEAPPDAESSVVEEAIPAAEPAKVVHFHSAADGWNALSETWEDARYVYIGRAVPRHNLPESPWHNPYKIVGADTPAARAQVIDLYRQHITPKVEAGALDLESLRGKTLVCWCKSASAPDTPCHGDVLVELLQKSSVNVAPENASEGANDAMPEASSRVALPSGDKLASSYLRTVAKRLITPHVQAGRSVEWLVLAGADGHLDAMDEHTSIDYSFGGKLVVSAAETIKLRDRQLGIVLRHEVSGNTYRVYDVDELYNEIAADLTVQPPATPALPDVDEDTPPTPPEPGALAVGDRVRTRIGHEGTVTKLMGALVYVNTGGSNYPHKPETLTKLAAAPVAPVETPKQEPEPEAAKTNDYTPDAGRVLAFLRETLRVRNLNPQRDDRVLMSLNDIRVYGGDARAACTVLALPMTAYFSGPLAESTDRLFDNVMHTEGATPYPEMAEDMAALQTWLDAMRDMYGLERQEADREAVL